MIEKKPGLSKFQVLGKKVKAIGYLKNDSNSKFKQGTKDIARRQYSKHATLRSQEEK